MTNAEKVKEMLDQIDDDPAHHLFSMGIKGKRLDPCKCPIVRYLKKNLPDTKIYTGMISICVYEGEDRSWVPMTQNIRNFVNAFDFGQHPELIEVNE